MTIEEYFGDWDRIVDVQEAERILKTIVSYKLPVCPLSKDVFKAFRTCSLQDLRVVIIGQDPYPNMREGTPIATGVAFANALNVPEKSYSPSLAILKESVIDFTTSHGRINFDSSLEKWGKQGVLMLNSALSCIAGKSGSHTLLWRPFMKTLLSNLSEHSTGIVYVLMGNSAQNLESSINGKSNHIVRIRHPAYYVRTNTRMPSDIWKHINKILIGQNGYGIEWYEEY